MSLRIVFMGTPEFAVPSLQILLVNGYDVAGVITATDKLGGRGKSVVIESAVKKFAVEHGIKVLQPRNLKDPAFQDELRSLQADLQVVVAFRMLPEAVWNMPPMGTMNLHGSLLPRYRGAAPINWAIIKGEAETGVSTFLLKHEIDTGDLLMTRSIPIHSDDTAGTVHDRMMEIGAQVVLESVQGLENDSLTPVPQDHSLATPAPKLYREMCEIDFGQSADVIHNFIRGLSPFPGAWTTVDGKTLKILLSQPDLAEHSQEPGTILVDSGSMRIACKTGWITVLKVQMEGKKRMETAEFVNGYRFEVLKAGART